MLNSRLQVEAAIIMHSYKFRLYPTQAIGKKLVETLEINRIVYNYFVSNRFRSRNDMNYALTELKEQQPILRKYHSKMLQMVSTKVEAARIALDTSKIRGQRTSGLKFCKLGKCNSFTYNQSGFHIVGNKLFLSKIGSIKIVLHRQPINIKQVTVIKQSGKWYALVTCETAKSIFKFIDPRKSIGIDVGIAKFSHDSEDYNVDSPLFLTRMLRPLRRAQRKVSRRKKGSRNREKAKNRIARLHERIANKRRDFLHRISRDYSNKYDIIFIERLRTLNMIKNHKIARYVLDSSWRTFKQLLGYKAKMVVEVEPAYTSIDCSRCGNKVPKSLAVRIHCCDRCGLVIDRDYNAALNILQRGLSYLPVERREVTPVETMQWSRKQEAYALERGQLT